MRRLPDRLIAHLAGLTLAGGDHDGEAFTVLPWQRRFVRGAFRVRGPAALTVARGCGKSCLVAGIATAVVSPEGPLHGRRREAVCVASSFSQSKVIFEDVLSFLRETYDLSDRRMWRLQDSANNAMVEHRTSGARVRCIGSDPAKAHGLRPSLVLADEPAQWDASRSDRMLAAIRTGLGKVPDSKLIALGTRPADDSHWFAKMLAGSAAYAQVHAARPTDSPFRVATWRKANPSLDHLPSLAAELREEAHLARSDPSMLAAFRALRLNGGTSDVLVSALLDAETWERIEGEAAIEGRPVWGLDLGTTAAMSAVAAYWPATGRLEAVAAFPALPDLGERGLRDGVGRLYLDMQRRGELVISGEHAVDIGGLLREALERFGAPVALAADRWREGELRDALKLAGVPLAALELRGQGFKDGGLDVRAFRRAVAEGAVTPWRSLLLTAAMGEARTVSDPAGNAKLAKRGEGARRTRAKDDAAAAAILAVALGVRRPARTVGAYLGAA